MFEQAILDVKAIHLEYVKVIGYLFVKIAGLEAEAGITRSFVVGHFDLRVNHPDLFDDQLAVEIDATGGFNIEYQPPQFQGIEVVDLGGREVLSGIGR